MSIVTFHSYVSTSEGEAKIAAVNRTSQRLNSFGERKAGWDLGRGEPIRQAAINDALMLLSAAFAQGLWRSNAFASPSGSVLLTFTMGPHDVEIGVEGDGTFDFCYQFDGDSVYEGSELDRAAVDAALADTVKKICTSEQSIQTTTTPTLVVSEPRHLSLRVTGAYRYSGENVQKAQAAQYASTSHSFIGTSQETLQYFGWSQPSPPELLCA